MNNKKIVWVCLSGGNDPYNTLVDMNHYETLVKLRPNIHIKENSLVDLTGDIKIHKSASSLKNLWDEGVVSIIQQTHYPNREKSHFRGTDIWWSAADGNNINNIGNSFLAEFLNLKYPSYPSDFPNTLMLDPLGLAVGSAGPGIMWNRKNGGKIGLTLSRDPNAFKRLVDSVDQDTIIYNNSFFGDLVNYIDNIDNGADEYSTRMSTIYQSKENKVAYPNNRLATQLSDISRLIAGGSNTQAYITSLGGFDTHADQVDKNDSSVGNHARLLDSVFSSIEAFYNDLKAHNVDDDVIIVTYTEFGRQIPENGAFGTDHGTSTPMFIIGSNVKQNIIGSSPDITKLDSAGIDPDLEYLFDYRDVLASIMHNHLGAGPNQLAASGLIGFNSNMDLFKSPYNAAYDENYLGEGGIGVDPDPDPIDDDDNVNDNIEKEVSEIKSDIKELKSNLNLVLNNIKLAIDNYSK